MELVKVKNKGAALSSRVNADGIYNSSEEPQNAVCSITAPV